MKPLRTLAFSMLLGLAGIDHAWSAEPLVDADWLQARLGEPGIVVLDIRNKIDGGSRAVFESGHIPGAVYSNYLTDGWRTTRDGIPGMLPEIADLERLIGGLGIGNGSRVVIAVAGVSAADYGSATRVYWTFKVLGHDAVSILDGGYAGWVRDGRRSLETGPVTPKPAVFRGTMRRELLATRDDVRRALGGGTALVDNRPPAQYRGEAKHPAAPRAGTLPGARNIPQDRFYNPETSTFADLKDITGLWQDQGIGADQEQIAFCNTGHWASLGWFASYALMGNSKARMYDGSMTEWSADPNRPMANSRASSPQ